jgi:signal transduction histidine kinase
MPFFTTSPQGSGLGLAAVRRIARAHGGRIDVESTVGDGSVFTLMLPLSADPRV